MALIGAQYLEKSKQPADVLRISFCVALLLHMVVILGITFNVIPVKPRPGGNRILEVTLAQRRSMSPPKQTDYLAQANQEGSGETAERVTPIEPAPPIFWSQEAQDNAVPAAAMADKANTPVNTVLNTTRSARFQTRLVSPEDKHEDRPETPPTTGDNENLAQTMASLLAKIEEQRVAIATRPRVRTIAAAAHENRDALYLEAWRKRIERIGNLNYPVVARQRHIYGDLRLLVAINANGTVRDVEIRESSGSAVLDDAAVRIVRLAAPFTAFPPSIRKDTDVLEIIRTWQFRSNYQLLARE
jgi:periplasmic protein TonB